MTSKSSRAIITDGIISCNIVVTLKRVRVFESSSGCVKTKIITMATAVSGQLFPYPHYPLLSSFCSTLSSHLLSQVWLVPTYSLFRIRAKWVKLGSKESFWPPKGWLLMPSFMVPS